MIAINKIIIQEHYDSISKMMEGLHDSEKELFARSAPWASIATNYMRHVIDTQQAEAGTCLMATDQGKPVGFIFGYTFDEEGSRCEDYEGLQLYVSDGYVAPSHRRLGIYKQLNDALEKIYVSDGVRRIVRFTLTSNTRMQYFLTQAGYQPVRLQYEKWLAPAGVAVQDLGLKKAI